jgi:hypothetical protein
MSEPEIIIAEPEKLTLQQVKVSPLEETLEEKQVTVHCSFNCPDGLPQLIRVWPSVFLIDKHSAHRSKLMFHDNITLYPYWTPVEGGKPYQFTLIFSGLPSSCILFDFLEEIPQEGGFFVPSITRNKTDVYHIVIQ